jgi:hypothetical protein
MLLPFKHIKKIVFNYFETKRIVKKNLFLIANAKKILEKSNYIISVEKNSINILIVGFKGYNLKLLASSLQKFYQRKIYFYYLKKNNNSENTFNNLIKTIKKNKIKNIILADWTNEILPMPYLAYFKKSKIRIFYNAHDTVSKDYLKRRFLNNKYINISFSKILLIDNPKFIFLSKKDITKKIIYKPLFLHSKLKINYRLIIKRKYDVAFIGQTVDYRDTRLKYLKKIQEIKNINKKIIHRRKQFQNITNTEYFDILGNAKIGLNFSQSVDGHQLKLRVFETLSSGCLLFEEENEQIKTHFKPGIHYVEFNYNNLQDKIIYYLKNQKEMVEIAKNGQKKYLKLKKDCKTTWKFICNAQL